MDSPLFVEQSYFSPLGFQIYILTVKLNHLEKAYSHHYVCYFPVHLDKKNKFDFKKSAILPSRVPNSINFKTFIWVKLKGLAR